MKKILSTAILFVLCFLLTIPGAAAAAADDGLPAVSAEAVTPPGKAVIWECKNMSYGVRVQWGEVPGADAYMVYRRSVGEEKYTRVKKTKALVYRDRAVENGKVYLYKVKAYKKVDGKEYPGKASSYKYTCFLPKAEISEVKNTSNGINVTWNEITGAKGYKLYRKTWEDTKYYLVKTTSETSYKDKDYIPANSQVRYKVKGYVKVNGGTYVGSTSAEMWTFWMTKPAIRSVTVKSGTATLICGIDAEPYHGTGIKGVQVQYTKGGETITEKIPIADIAEADGGYSISVAAGSGKTSQYRIRSYFEMTGKYQQGIWYSAWSDPVDPS